MRQCFEYHPVTGYRFVPGLRARVPHEGGGYLLRVNQQGFRCDRDFCVGRDGALRRVLVFGDSFTEGLGVSNGKRYSDLIEGMLPETEVYNFGLSSTGTDQQFLAWREFARSIEHDVLVISVLVENVRRNLSQYRPYRDDSGRSVIFAKPYFELGADGALSLHHSPPEPLPLSQGALSARELSGVDRGGRFERLRSVARRLGLQGLAQRLTRFQPVPEYGSRRTPGWRLLRAILARWVYEHGDPSRIVIMPLPLYQHVEGTASARGYQARFAEFCAETGCTLHDPLPDLMRYSPEQRRGFRFPIDVHPTTEGHAAIAKSLAPTIASLLSRRTVKPINQGAPNR